MTRPHRIARPRRLLALLTYVVSEPLEIVRGIRSASPGWIAHPAASSCPLCDDAADRAIYRSIVRCAYHLRPDRTQRDSPSHHH